MKDGADSGEEVVGSWTLLKTTHTASTLAADILQLLLSSSVTTARSEGGYPLVLSLLARNNFRLVDGRVSVFMLDGLRVFFGGYIQCLL